VNKPIAISRTTATTIEITEDRATPHPLNFIYRNGKIVYEYPKSIDAYCVHHRWTLLEDKTEYCIPEKLFLEPVRDSRYSIRVTYERLQSKSSTDD
jgi:hypothetical protein